MSRAFNSSRGEWHYNRGKYMLGANRSPYRSTIYAYRNEIGTSLEFIKDHSLSIGAGFHFSRYGGVMHANVWRFGLTFHIYLTEWE